MVVMTERPRWSDERLDDLSERMDDGFRRNDEEHQEIRQAIKEGFDGLNARLDAQDAKFEARLDAQDAKFEARLDKQDARFEARFDKQDARFEDRMGRLEARMDKFQHTLFIFSGGLIGTLIAAVIALTTKAIA